MAWIESHDNLGEHPKVYALSTALNVRKTTCVGVLHLLWHFTLKFAWRDGDLTKFSAETIARSIGHDGDANELIKALQDTGWLDGMVVHDWFDYAGRIIKDRIYNEKRRNENNACVKRRKTSAKRPQNDVCARKIGATNQTNQTNQTNLKEGYFLDESFCVVFDEFIAMREEMRKPVTETARKAIIKKLEAVDIETAKEMLKQSIENNWQGIFTTKSAVVLDKEKILNEQKIANIKKLGT